MVARFGLLKIFFERVQSIRDQWFLDAVLQHEDDVVFAGLCNDPDLPKFNSFDFWVYAPNGVGGFEAIPVSTYSDELFDIFRQMQPGQVFRILQEDSDGAIVDIDRNVMAYPVLSKERLLSFESEPASRLYAEAILSQDNL